MERLFAAFPPDQTLYVRLDAVMPPLFAFTDGLRFRATQDGNHWITVDDAIKWCRAEIQYVSEKDKARFETAIAVLQGASERNARGEFTDVPVLPSGSGR